LIYRESCDPAQPVAISAGVELRRNFTLAAVRSVHVRGMVSGVPDGARVVIRIGHNTGRIAVNGKFDLAGIAPGTYTLEGLADIGGRAALASARVDVGASGTDNVTLTFVPGVVVTGTVRPQAEDASIGINLVPSDPAFDAGKAEWDASQRSFVFPSVAPGRYRVAVTPPHPPYYVKSIEIEGQDIHDRELVIESPVSIDIVVGEGLGSVAGSVADDSGNPVSGDVLLLRGNQAPWRGSAQSDGRFSMENIPPGEYRAYAFDDSHDVEYADPVWMQRNAGKAAAVTITSGNSAAVSLIRVTVPK
jgi:hypothetical protein